MPCRIEARCELLLFIGCSFEERSVEQPVVLELHIESQGGFLAQHSDELAETIDVHALRMAAAEVARAARVQTLERLAFLIQATLREKFAQPGLLWELRLEKIRAEWTYVQTWST